MRSDNDHIMYLEVWDKFGGFRIEFPEDSNATEEEKALILNHYGLYNHLNFKPFEFIKYNIDVAESA